MRLTAPSAPTPRTVLRQRLSALGYQTYRDYLASRHWAATRASYRAATDLPQVCICGATKVQLHHRTYERLGEERLTDLYPLCPMCHSILHVYIRQGLVAPEVDPTTLTRTDVAERHARTLAIARDHAAKELLSPIPLNILDRTIVRALRRRANELNRARTRSRLRPGRPGERDGDHATLADVQNLRRFDP